MPQSTVESPNTKSTGTSGEDGAGYGYTGAPAPTSSTGISPSIRKWAVPRSSRSRRDGEKKMEKRRERFVKFQHYGQLLYVICLIVQLLVTCRILYDDEFMMHNNPLSNTNTHRAKVSELIGV